MHPDPDELPTLEDWRRMQESNGRCGTCGSSSPHRHPSVQHDGEVEICADTFHLRQTPQNVPAYIAEVERKRAAQKTTD